ncbi:MAG: restriction endonuclease, partial [Candidatus Marinimicrobia bacterium]|nr:restriction endonuclease [Candidatus Neomarinimicrobiota bacterium]
MKKWEKFERLVAAINRTSASGGEVIWNARIKGRQFDVSIQFRFDTYKHLILLECRDRKRKCTLSEIEAFVTKASDAGADEIIVVSSSGFQSGATTVAKKHNVRLYTLKEINELPPDVVLR